MKDIQTAILPLSVVLCLCGFGVFEYPQNQPRFCFTIFYILISWLFYAYIAFKMAIFLRKNELTYTMFHYSNMIFAILYMLSNFYYNKKFKSCLNKLNIVSNTIEKLGTSKNYTKLRLQITWLITGWIILVSLIDINDYVWYHEHIPRSYSIMAICAPIGNHPIHINTLYDFMYMMLLRYIGFQFEHVNKYIQKLAEQKKVGYANSTLPLTHRHIAGTKTLSKQNIWILMHIHLKLCSISRELNMIFGLQMMMQVIAFHIFTVQIIYQCYVTMIADFTHEKLLNLLSIYFWIIIIIIKMIILNYICERICNKANSVEIFLNRLTNLTFDVETYEAITQFLFQILRRPLKISGFDLFNFGFKFLLECVKFIAMIIVFVLQSPPQGESFIGAELIKIL